MSTDDGGTMIVGRDNIEWVRRLSVRAALRLEILTGMRRSNRGRSTPALANEITGTNHKNKRKAYEALNKDIVAALGEDFDKPLPERA